jgi:hypothetical protein
MPQTGRWNAEDPDGFTAGDSNLYRYVGNDPTNATDPTGLIIDKEALDAINFAKELIKANGAQAAESLASRALGLVGRGGAAATIIAAGAAISAEMNRPGSASYIGSYNSAIAIDLMRNPPRGGWGKETGDLVRTAVKLGIPKQAIRGILEQDTITTPGGMTHEQIVQRGLRNTIRKRADLLNVVLATKRLGISDEDIASIKSMKALQALMRKRAIVMMASTTLNPSGGDEDREIRRNRAKQQLQVLQNVAADLIEEELGVLRPAGDLGNHVWRGLGRVERQSGAAASLARELKNRIDQLQREIKRLK